MAKNDKNLYLLGFDENELVEIYQALALKDELDKRKALQEHDGQKELAQLLARIKNQFAPKTAARLKENAVAAMEVPASHQPRERSEAKKDSMSCEAFRLSAIPSPTLMTQ